MTTCSRLCEFGNELLGGKVARGDEEESVRCCELGEGGEVGVEWGCARGGSAGGEGDLKKAERAGRCERLRGMCSGRALYGRLTASS